MNIKNLIKAGLLAVILFGVDKLGAAAGALNQNHNENIGVTVLEEHTNNVTALAFSPDGRQIIAGYNGNAYGAVKVWNTATMKCVTEFGISVVNSLVFGPNGRLRVSGFCNSDGYAYAWDGDIFAYINGINLCRKEVPRHGVFGGGDIRSVAFSQNGELLLTGYIDGKIKIWNTQTWECVEEISHLNSSIATVALSPDGSLLAVGNCGGYVRVLDRRACNKCVKEFCGRPGSCGGAVAFSPDGKLMASGYDFEKICIWDTVAWQIVATLEASYVIR